jgi:hypothetical protein
MKILQKDIKRVLGLVGGSFSKAIPGSIAVNFTQSGGSYCDNSCLAKQLKICYAMPIEATKSTVRKGLQMKEANLEYLFKVLGNHAPTIKRIVSAPWIRFSAFGAFPDPSMLSETAIANFKKFATQLKPKIEQGVVHFPTETLSKYNFLKSLGFKPRLSFQRNVDAAISFPGLSSIMVREEKRFTGNLIDRRPVHSLEVLRRISQSGKRGKICPSIVNKKIKCGTDPKKDIRGCIACGSDVDIIIYPEH